MTIPAISGAGSLSTTAVPDTFIEPESRQFFALISYERGPIALENTTEGLLYQNWTVTYAPFTGVLTATPETTLTPVVIGTIMGLVSLAFTFDQNGRISYVYTTAVSSYMYWYDSAEAGFVTTDLGATAITPVLYLDDKRSTQNAVNDMLLWYTKLSEGGLYELYMRRQRDRFITEYLMRSGLAYSYIHNNGMHRGLRGQLVLKPVPPNMPYVP